MKEPKRLKDMPQTPPALRADLEASRVRTPYDTGRAWALFEARLDELAGAPDVGANPTGATATSDEGPPPTGETLDPVAQGAGARESLRSAAAQLAPGSYWGLVATGLTVGVLAGAAALVQSIGESKNHPVPQQGRPSPSQAESPRGALPARSPSPAPHPEEPKPLKDALMRSGSERISSHLSAPTLPIMPPSSVRPAKHQKPSGRPPAPPTLGESTPPDSPLLPSRLARETNELTRLRGEAQRDPSTALANLRKSAFWGSGQLEPERRALEVELLLSVGKIGEARIKARTFVLTYPGSPAAARLACIRDGSTRACP